MGSSQSIPAFFKTIQGFTESSSTDSVCTSEPLAIQYAIQQLPEFKNTYTVKIKDITAIPDNNLQCDVQFMYSSPETGFTKNEIRRVTFIKTPEGDPIVDSISRRLNEINEPTAVSSKEVLEYYNILSKYNQNWVKSGWKLKNASYNPPIPLWNDPIFMKNIDIYNNNFNIVIDKIKDSAATPDGIELFKKYIAPLPADPIPPKASKILLPVKQLAGSASGSYVDETAID